MHDDEWGEPTWLESGNGHVAAWVHRPHVGLARGVVVVAPAVDREHVVSHRAMVVLAHELCAAGLVAVRFAFRGDGDSDPLTGDDVPALWQQDLDGAVGLAQELVPGVPVDVVGLRLGASVVAASRNRALGRRVLWEPVSGRRYLRAQAMLRKVSLSAPAAPEEAGTELPGKLYTPGQSAHLKRLAAPASSDGAVRMEVDRAVAAQLYAVVSRDARVPRSAIAEIVARFEGGASRELPDWSPQTVACSQLHGSRIVQRNVWLPGQLPAVVVEPLDGEVTSQVVFCPAGSEPKDGPTGLWATAARRLAAQGVRSLRVERRGTGELLDPTEDGEPVPYRLDSAVDMAGAIQWLRNQAAAPITAVALSAGGWILARASEWEPPDRLVMINNVGWHVEESRYARLYDRSLIQRLLSTPVPTGDEVHEPVVDDSRKAQVKEALKQVRAGVMAAVPMPAWRLLARAGVVMDPAALLRRVPPQTEVVVCMGEADAQEWRQSHGPQALAELAEEGRPVVARTAPVLDHALLTDAARRWVLEELDERLPVGGSTRPSGGAGASGADMEE